MVVVDPSEYVTVVATQPRLRELSSLTQNGSDRTWFLPGTKVVVSSPPPPPPLPPFLAQFPKPVSSPKATSKTAIRTIMIARDNVRG